MKGNRQGSLSRPITRRSDQNRKIKCSFYFAILPASLSKKSIRTFSTSWQALAPASLCCRRGDVWASPPAAGTVSRCRGRRPRRPRMTVAPRRGRRPRHPASCHSEPVTASLAWESVSLQEKNGLPRRCAPRSKCPWGTPRNDRLFRSPETDAGFPLFVNLQNPTTKTEEDVV